MPNVAIVFLNFKNYKDTMDAIDSVLFFKLDVVGIIVVENGSDNASYQKLSQKYKEQNKVFILENKKNLGFAKGNNVGIKFARENLKADFVLTANNDTMILQEDYLERLLKAYKKGIGIIGSEIQLPNGSIQKPIKSFTTLPGLLWFYLHLLSLMIDARWLIDYCVKKMEKYNSKKTELLHGCILLMTPDFFKKYNGFYPKTFLYCEEELLYMMCQEAGLKQIKVENAVLYHKEGQSSAFLYDNKFRKKVRYMINSYKWVILFNLLHYKSCNNSLRILIRTKAE